MGFTRTHRPGRRVAKARGAVAEVDPLRRSRHQQFNALTGELVPRVAEERLSLRVHQQDHPSASTATMASGTASTNAATLVALEGAATPGRMTAR
jgi:hypothetical protein